jgi:hypothetical protein
MQIYDGFTARQVSAHKRQPVTSDSFARRAEEILGLMHHLRGELGLTEAINVVLDRYVDAEAHPELKLFGEVLGLARRQALLQHRLDDDREELHSGHLGHEAATSVGHHYTMLRREACQYNHLLRGLIESCGEYFTRDDLMRWLTTASQGRNQWAKAEITGATSEVALHAALQGLPELKGLRYATLDEDLKGYDFVAEWQGSLLTIDAKTGFYAPLNETKHGHRHLEISVPREAVQNFRVTRRGLDGMRHQVRRSLQQGAGVREHGPHVHYRAAQAY